jgi:drug/metabolite transporter (DMT)-like permease
VRKHIPALVALAIVVVWGLNFTLLKDSLAQFDALSFTWLRYLGMLILAWTVVLVTRHPRLPPPREAGRVAAAGLVGYSGYIVLSLVGLSFTTAFSNALLIAAAPLVTALLLWPLAGERLGGRRAFGLAVGAAGVAVFMSDKLAHGFAAAGVGDLISLAAAALFATYTVLVKPLAGRHPATSVSAWTLTVGAVPVLIFALPSLVHQDWARVQLSGWLLLAWAIVVPVYLAWTLWSWASARAGVAATNAFLYLVPVVSGISSFLLLGEGFAPLKLAGAGLVLAGLVLARRESKPATQQVGIPGEPLTEERDRVRLSRT